MGVADVRAVLAKCYPCAHVSSPSGSGRNGRHPTKGSIVPEQESQPGGPHYGGDQGGESAGSSGGQGGQGEAAGESGEKSAEDPGGESGVSGRGPTERDGEPTTADED